MMRSTVNHTKIKQWAESLNGKPQIIDDPQAKQDTPGLRINFPDKSNDLYLSASKHGRDTTWEDFFKIFEQEQLAFLYEAKPSKEDLSDAFQFIKRDQLK